MLNWSHYCLKQKQKDHSFWTSGHPGTLDTKINLAGNSSLGTAFGAEAVQALIQLANRGGQQLNPSLNVLTYF